MEAGFNYFRGEIEAGLSKITHEKQKLDEGIFIYEIKPGLMKIAHEK